MTAPFSIAGARRFALANARALASHLPAKITPVDRDGFALVDILIDRHENVWPTLAPNAPLTEMRLRPKIAAEEL